MQTWLESLIDQHFLVEVAMIAAMSRCALTALIFSCSVVLQLLMVIAGQGFRLSRKFDHHLVHQGRLARTRLKMAGSITAEGPNIGGLLSLVMVPLLRRFPHHIEIDVEVAVGHAIAHVAHTAPRHFGMRLGELGVAVHHLRGSLADDDEAHDDGLLGAFIRQEVVFGQPFHKAARIGGSLLDVVQVIG